MDVLIVIVIACVLIVGLAFYVRSYRIRRSLILRQRIVEGTSARFTALEGDRSVQRTRVTIDPEVAALRRQLGVARALLETKQYAQARELLKTINHPTAQNWLEKLDAGFWEPPEAQTLFTAAESQMVGSRPIARPADTFSEDANDLRFTALESDFADDDFDSGGDE